MALYQKIECTIDIKFYAFLTNDPLYYNTPSIVHKLPKNGDLRGNATEAFLYVLSVIIVIIAIFISATDFYTDLQTI